MAVDGAGNVYIADPWSDAIKKWTAANGTVTTLVSSGLSEPGGVAVDGAGNVYFADTNAAIREWTAANGTVTTLVPSGLNYPEGVAVDRVGNVYIADTGNSAIKEWTAANGTVTTLVASGLDYPGGVAVDGAGNVYIADTENHAIKEWTAATGTISTPVASGLNGPMGVAVDGSGNVYIADTNNAVKKWTAATGALTTLVASGLEYPRGVAVDGGGNVYIADLVNKAIYEWPRAFVDTTVKAEPAAAGSDVLPVVLPATMNLSGPFAPTSDAAWLTIGGINNGVVSFSFAANPGLAARTGHLLLLGQSIAITQPGVPFVLAASNRVEGPAAGADSVVLSAPPPLGAWVAMANTPWLHVSAASQSGVGSANVVFSFDANSGATRAGTLTIAGQTLAVTQAGASYIAANPLTTLVSSGLNDPWGVAVDGAGNVYIADSGNSAIKEWTVANGTVNTLFSMGRSFWAGALAVDGAGNVYFADYGWSAVKKWTAATGTISTLVASGLNEPLGVAVDGVGNVYIADTFDHAIQEWTAANGTVSTLVASGLDYPYGVAVDGAGNVYVADGGHGAIQEWTAADGMVTALVVSGLNYPRGVAVDGAGNVYIADWSDNAVKEWTAANGTVTTLVPAGLTYPFGVAVDGAGNVYIADTDNQAIKEVPRAFVDTTAKAEPAAAGSDVLPVVLPATANLSGPFAPTNDAAWLTLNGINQGVVSFSFTANSLSSTRTAHITLLGQSISVNQAAARVPPTPPVLTGWRQAGGGGFSIVFSNDQGASFTVLSSTNLALPLTDWTVLGTPTNNGSGLFQFTAPSSPSEPERYYRVRSP